MSVPIRPRTTTAPARTGAVVAVLTGLACTLAGGCFGGSPSAANIALRKEVDGLKTRVDQLEREKAADAATIRSLQEQHGATTVPTLSQDRLGRLFTVAGLTLNRLTGGADSDPSKPGDEALRVFAVPTDQNGDEIKAAGRFVVEAFDLKSKEPRVGRWEFDLEKAKAAWNGEAMLYEYVLVCPWQSPPSNPELTVKVTFTDELTGRVVEAQKTVAVKLAQ